MSGDDLRFRSSGIRHYDPRVYYPTPDGGLAPRVEHGETLYTQIEQMQHAPAGPCTPECAQQTRELAVCACILAIGTLLIGAVFGWALHAVMHGGGGGQ